MKRILIFLFLSLPASLALLAPGGYEPHDLHHLADIHQMHAALSSRQFPPRLGPDFLLGFGYPLFNFYYVLPFYIGAAFYSLGFSLMSSFELVFVVSVVFSVYGMYALLNRFFGKWASAFGAILYLYTPFRAVEIYVRGAIGEALAIAILPWLLYFLASLIKQTSARNVAVFACVFALFLLTHNYFFILAFPFIGIFTLVLLHKEKKRLAKLKGLFAGGILGLAMSAYWWLPALVEYKLVASTTPFVMEEHFPFLKQLVVPSWGYGSSVWGPGDELSFQIGIVNLVVVVLALVLLIKQRRSKNIKFRLAGISLLLFIGYVFMMNIRSLHVWQIIPFTNFIQFPWRLLSMSTFLTAFLAGFVVDNLRHKRLFASLFVAACMLLTFSYFKPSKITFKSDEEYIAHFFGNPQYSEDYLQLPVWTAKKPTSPPSKRFFAINADIEEREVSKVHWRAEINAYEEAEVYVNVLAFPGWAVDVDGVAVETYPGEPYGQLAFVVGKGAYQVEVYWEETKLRLLADLVSLGAFLIVALLYLRQGAWHATI